MTIARSYYNENDQFAAAWLRELIADNLIAPGDVDERSIEDVQAKDLEGYTQCHFFAGIGGWSQALRLAGWPDERPVWTGSCPCQPFSAAGKRLGVADKRHLWPQFHRLIGECRPAIVFGEQTASADGHKWLAGVRADLEKLEYGVGCADLCAAGVGAPHIRQRLWWVADNSTATSRLGDADAARPQGWGEHPGEHADQRTAWPSMLPRGVADAHGAGYQSELPVVGGDPTRDESRAERIVGLDGPDSRLADADQRSERLERGGGRELCIKRKRVARPGPGGGGNDGFWSDFDLLPCTDGKSRRVEPGTFPLVARLPPGVVPSGDPSIEEVQATAEARGHRLRGYGNSIVPQVAAEFIGAYMNYIDITI